MPGYGANSDGVQPTPLLYGTPLCCGGVTSLLLSPFIKMACMHPSRHERVCPVLSCRPPAPRTPQPRAISVKSRTTSWQGFIQTEPPATRERRRNRAPQFWIKPKKQREKKPAPSKRKREGKSGRRLNHLERCPKPLGACDRSLFYPFTREIGFLCLILNCKWQQQLPM